MDELQSRQIEDVVQLVLTRVKVVGGGLESQNVDKRAAVPKKADKVTV